MVLLVSEVILNVEPKNGSFSMKDEVFEDSALRDKSYDELANNELVKDGIGDQTLLRVDSIDEPVLKVPAAQGISPKVTISNTVSYKLPDDTLPLSSGFTKQNEPQVHGGILK